MIDNTTLEAKVLAAKKLCEENGHVLWTSSMLEGDSNIVKVISCDRESAGNLLSHCARIIYGHMELFTFMNDLIELLMKETGLSPATHKALQRFIYVGKPFAAYAESHYELTEKLLGLENGQAEEA
jgi:hypothetical protein